MGLDYSFNVIINRDNQKKAISLIKEQSNLFEENRYSVGVTATFLVFKEDEFIREYHEWSVNSDLQHNTNPNANLNDYRIGADKFWIGCIYLSIENHQEPNKIRLNFSAATSRMSVLFSQSNSIIEFFKEFCKNTNADYGYLDMEEDGVKEIWNK